jgi:hypothetical protein
MSCCTLRAALFVNIKEEGVICSATFIGKSPSDYCCGKSSPFSHPPQLILLFWRDKVG